MKMWIFIPLLFAVVIADISIAYSISAPKECYAPNPAMLLNIPKGNNVACYIPKSKQFYFCYFNYNSLIAKLVNPVMVNCGNVAAPNPYTTESGIINSKNTLTTNVILP